MVLFRDTQKPPKLTMANMMLFDSLSSTILRLAPVFGQNIFDARSDNFFARMADVVAVVVAWHGLPINLLTSVDR